MKVDLEKERLEELIDKIKIEIERQQNILKQQPSDNKDYDEYFNQHLSSISNLIKECELCNKIYSILCMKNILLQNQ